MNNRCGGNAVDLPVEKIKKFLGKQVTAKLNDGLVTQGQLLGFGEGGDFEILEDDGFIHYCWPMLKIEERKQ